MWWYVIVALLVVEPCLLRAPPPLRLTIDCGSKERDPSLRRWRPSQEDYNDSFHVESFCDLIQNALPKAIRNGQVLFVENDPDQDGFGNTHVPISMPPPEGFVPKIELPKFRVTKLRIPKMKVPTLKLSSDRHAAPRVGSSMMVSSMNFPTFREISEDSSSERMEKFKKGVRKMLHVVKVLGQIDQYLSERTRIIVDKLSKTFAE